MALYDLNYPKNEADLEVVCYDAHKAGQTFTGRLEKADRIFHAKWVKAGTTYVDFFDSKQGVSDWMGNFHGDQSLVAERQFFVAHGIVLRILPIKWNETEKKWENTDGQIPFRDVREIGEGLVEIHRENKILYKSKIRDILDPMLLQPVNIGAAWDAGNNVPFWQFVHTNYAPTSRRDYWPLIPPIPFAGGRIIKVKLQWERNLVLADANGTLNWGGLTLEFGLVGLVCNVVV